MAQHFIRKFSEELDKQVDGMEPACFEVLSHYAFPGNVRELENLIERAVALSREPMIGVDLLPPQIARSGLNLESRARASISKSSSGISSVRS